MPWIPMYLNGADIRQLNDWLNNEQEIAFLLPNGESKWIARQTHDISTEIETATKNTFRYSLWHIQGGNLPLLRGKENEMILDPWQGWTEERAGADPSAPYFGPGLSSVFHLTLYKDHPERIGMSNFQWIGSRYSVIGLAPEKSTEKWWNKLRRFIKKSTEQLPRKNDPTRKKEVFTFKGAHDEILAGKACALG